MVTITFSQSNKMLHLNIFSTAAAKSTPGIKKNEGKEGVRKGKMRKERKKEGHNYRAVLNTKSKYSLFLRLFPHTCVRYLFLQMN